MAYDKVIDSGKLNSALTATANAIRSKTGKTAKITWNESTGFASNVNSISTGGGGGEIPTGVCESLTINFSGYECDLLFVSRNGEYEQMYIGGETPFTIENVDVNTPVFTVGLLYVFGFFQVSESTNINALLLDESGYCILECTSNEPASISIEVVE